MTLAQIYFTTLITIYGALFVAWYIADAKRMEQEKRRRRQLQIKRHENFMKWLDIVGGK